MDSKELVSNVSGKSRLTTTQRRYSKSTGRKSTEKGTSGNVDQATLSESIASSADSLVRIFPTPDEGQDWPGKDLDCSSRPFAWFENCNPERSASVGALHIRDRVFVVAYSVRDSYGINDSAKQARHPKDANTGGTSCGSDKGKSSDVADPRRKLRKPRAVSESSCETSPHGDAEAKDNQRRGEDVADANSTRLKGACGSEAITERYRQRAVSRSSWWDAEPDVGRVANGIPKRVDRLRCLGNAIVPQVAEVVARMTKQQLDW